MAPPDLSIVMVTAKGLSHIRKTLNAVAAQTIRDRIELILVATRQPAIDERELRAIGFHTVKVIACEQIESTGEALARGVQAASADVVAYAEEHGYPRPDWAEARLAAHRQGWDAVGGRVINANPATAVSEAALLLSFASAIDPVDGAAWHLPWHQTSYRREVLRALGDKLGFYLECEGLLHAEIVRRGARLYQSSRPSVDHVNASRFGVHVRMSCVAGRVFGAARAHAGSWSAIHRAVRVAILPAVIAMKAAQGLRAVVEHTRGTRRRVSVAAVMIVSSASHALGECVGYVFGARAAVAHLVDFEQNRRAQLVSDELPIMMA